MGIRELYFAEVTKIDAVREAVMSKDEMRAAAFVRCGDWDGLARWANERKCAQKSEGLTSKSRSRRDPAQ